MRDFGRSAGRLATLEPAAKGVYSLWMVFALTHFVSSFGMYWDRTMRSPAGEPRSHFEAVADYYAGDEPNLVYPKPFSRLMEITHQHLFAMPLTLLVASHLYLMTRRSLVEKRAVIALAGASMAAHLAAPWAVRYGGAAFAWAMPVTGLPFGATFTWMTVLPLKDMWWPAREGEMT